MSARGPKPTSRILPPWRRSKKLSRPRGGSPRQARARHTPRGLVPGRDAGRPEKQTHLSRWARKGSRPCATHDQRTQSTYLFGAVCPERGAGVALVLPACNSEAMQLHLDEIATKVTQVHTRSCSSIKPAGMAPRFLRSRAISGLQILRRYRRSLLLRLEQAHRSALEDHVRRTPRLGQRGLLRACFGWVKSGDSP